MARRITDKHLRALRSFASVAPDAERIVVSLDETDRITDDGIRIIHWKRFLNDLWNDVLRW